ncbi:MAG TPA: YfiR family protein [Candidatus Limnocylindrales bacterium]|nr:YfiR family protein [Candidatus Limnocylindrales bacterium]
MAPSQENNRRRLGRACADAWLGLRRFLAPPVRGRRVAYAMLLLPVMLTTPASAQVSKEYQLKAVFLWRLAQFTEWPSDAFENPESPIVICVLGDNPFDGALSAAVSGETAHGRRFVVQLLRVIEQAKTCHILYTTSGAARQAKEIATALAGKSVLTVRDGSASASSFETMIVLISEQNKIRMRINLKAAVAARLVLDPRLLRAAEVIGE